MDHESHSPDDPDDARPQPTKTPGLVLSRVTSAPEPRRSFTDVPFSPSSFDITPRKRDLPTEGSYRRPMSGQASPPARDFWPSGSTSPRGEVGEPPDKRPRLEYIPEKMEHEMDSARRRMFPHHVRTAAPSDLLLYAEATAGDPKTHALMLTIAVSPVQFTCSHRRATTTVATSRRYFSAQVLARIMRQLLRHRVSDA